LKVAKGKFVLSFLPKILLALIFVLTGLLSSFYAFIISIEGMREDSIRCMTGAATFPLMGLFINVIGIPLLLFFKSSKPAHKLYNKTGQERS
jgi:phosphoglycerol transferase MdoB-like AlkP superfamily enzyme